MIVSLKVIQQKLRYVYDCVHLLDRAHVGDVQKIINNYKTEFK